MIKFKVKFLLICVLVVEMFFAVLLPVRAVSIREGTFIKVVNPSEISTLLYDVGDKVCMINSTDIYVYETNAIPEGSLVCGYVEDLLEPVQGKNAGIKIKMNKVITTDKRVFPINAYLYSPHDNYLGAEETIPKYYQKVPHYSTKFKPMLQFAPVNVYEEGTHTVIMAGTELLLLFIEPAEIDN
ncbi:hypothetical protein IKQ26_04560 [bacterium]|nr:hypothetical protein [bacterium]